MSPLAALLEPRGDVNDTTTVLVFVPVLATFAGAGKPFDLDITICDLKNVLCPGTEDGYGNRTGVNSTTTFRRWHSLNAMATGFEF